MKAQNQDDAIVTIHEDQVIVERVDQKTAVVSWKDLEEIKVINSDSKVLAQGIWLVLIDSSNQCFIPHNTESFNKAIQIASKLDGFYINNLEKALSSSGAESFILWQRSPRD